LLTYWLSVEMYRDLGSSMKFLIPLLFLILILTQGCSKSANPVKFSKIENQKVNSINVEESSKDKAPSRKLTLLEMYLEKQVTRDYMMEWFFNDITIYRDKIFYIKDEVSKMQPLSEYNVSRVKYLEAGMNAAIQRFNSKNAIIRSAAFASAIAQTQRVKKDRYTQFENDELEIRGAPAAAISNSPWGFLASFINYGFTIERVDFLGRR